MSLWIGLAKRKILCSGYYGYLENMNTVTVKMHKWQSNTTVLKRLNSLILISISTRMGAYCLVDMAKWLWNQTYHRFFNTKHWKHWNTKRSNFLFYKNQFAPIFVRYKNAWNKRKIQWFLFFDHLSMHWNWWNNGIFRKLLELIALKERGRENWLMT